MKAEPTSRNLVSVLFPRVLQLVTPCGAVVGTLEKRCSRRGTCASEGTSALLRTLCGSFRMYEIMYSKVKKMKDLFVRYICFSDSLTWALSGM